jgi:hypothetical protein
MSWLDRLLGRGKKAMDDVMGDRSTKSEGMHQEQSGMGTEGAESAGQMGQEGGQPADQDAQRDNP